MSHIYNQTDHSVISSTAALLHQCSLNDGPPESQAIASMPNRLHTSVSESVLCKIHRRNAVGDLSEGIDAKILQQLQSFVSSQWISSTMDQLVCPQFLIFLKNSTIQRSRSNRLLLKKTCESRVKYSFYLFYFCINKIEKNFSKNIFSDLSNLLLFFFYSDFQKF